MSSPRLVFMGTAELACTSLLALFEQPDLHLAAVVTQPDRPVGRNLQLTPPPVKLAALPRHIPILQPLKARDPAFIAQLQQLRPDLIIVVAYGQLIPQPILDLPPFGCVNVHTSLIPKYRGAAPIQWAILNDEPVTGVTLMQMDATLDTGAVLAQTPTPITPEDNAQSLHDRLARLGADLLLQTLPKIFSRQILPRPQDHSQATHARKITKQDGHIDWSLPARAIWNRIRAFVPWPGTYTTLPSQPQPRLLKILQANVLPTPAGPPGQILAADKSGLIVACGQQALQITSLQPEGKRPMTAAQFLAGHHLQPGQQFLSPPTA